MRGRGDLNDQRNIEVHERLGALGSAKSPLSQILIIVSVEIKACLFCDRGACQLKLSSLELR